MIHRWRYRLAQERFWVQLLMRGGLFLAGSLFFAGLVVKMAQGDSQAVPFTITSFFTEHWRAGDLFLSAGALVLTSIPILRVFLLAVWWVIERDWIFVGVTAIVFLTLALSATLGGH